MKLSLTERLQFGTILPEKGDYVTLTIKADIVNKVSVTQEEMTEWELKFHDDGRYTWDAKKAKEIDVDFTGAEAALIVKKLKELDAAKQLDDVTYSFFKKFN